MAMEQSHWIAASHLPASSNFHRSPWEQRHRDELAFRHGAPPSLPLPQPDADLPPFSPQIHREQTFQLFSVREAELVTKSLYALQGSPVAVQELQQLARLFSHQVTDRSSHRLSNLWQRSASTKALGKLLADMAQAGCIRMQLEEFVDFFLKPQKQNINLECFVAGYEMPSLRDAKVKRRGKVKVEQFHDARVNNEDLNSSPPYSLVNQAYARAVKTVLQGHSAALNTLTTSALCRRSAESCNYVSLEVLDECVGAVICDPCEMTLLELFLHTNKLRVQLHILAALCLYDINAKNPGKGDFEDCGDWSIEVAFSAEDLPSTRAFMDFSAFPKGADLLTFLYKRLQEADTGNVELLRFLFSSACQPYLSFIQSWLYRATVTDPYKEFIVVGTLVTADTHTRGMKKDNHLFSLKMQASVSAPCFLENICNPLLRAGQQLQVLLGLAETGIADISHNLEHCTSDGFGMLKSALKYWTEFASEDSVFFPGLVFSKGKLLALAKERRSKRHALMQNFDSLLSSLRSQTEGFGLFRHLSIEKRNGHDVKHEVLEIAVQNENDLRHLLTEENKNDESRVCMTAVETCRVATSPASEWSYEQPGNESRINSSQGCSEKDDELMPQNEQESAQENFSPLKQRKRWEKPTEAVVVHNQAEVLSERKVSKCVPYPSAYMSEIGTIYGRLSQIDNSNLYTLGNLKYHGYSFPPFGAADSFLKLLLEDPSEDELSSMLQSLKKDSGASFFFPDVHVDKINSGEYFGRSFIHKLAQTYNFSRLSQDGGYRKTVLNFDMISRVFWNFEDCITSKNFNFKAPLHFSSTSNSDTIQKPISCTDNVHAIYTDMSYDTVKQMTVQKLSENSTRKGQLIVDNFSVLENMVETSVKNTNDMGLKMVIVDHAVETDVKSSQKKEFSSGGATWETYLTGNRGKTEVESLVISEDILADPDIPLEVIVDNCIIQEVLSQYQCISYLSVRLLNEVFGLQEHFAALRRYFLMERGDWADLFITMLYHHVWHAAGIQQRQVEVQKLLETAIRNSSCEQDNYAERLHIYIDTQSEDAHHLMNTNEQAHLNVNKTSVSAFDFIKLGYNVEWPVNLIITPESFTIYNSIFSFLIRAKLAVHALQDIWQLMKGMSGMFGKENIQINQTLILLRQNMSHFMMTFQGYIESQLLHNVWSKFLQALCEEGQDLQKMELMHNVYLQDALHVCFLSDEMESVKSSIDNVMQCLLDLRSCLYYLGIRGDDGRSDTHTVKVKAAVTKAKNHYDSSIQQLHHIIKNSCNQLPFNHLWTRLDFNGFLGDNTKFR